MHPILPEDWREALLVGRMDFGDGPTPVAVVNGRLKRLSRIAPTVSLLLENPALARGGEDLGDLTGFEFHPAWRVVRSPALLSPIDLQCIKAAGVTFAVSTMERIIEERALGDPAKAGALRARLETRVGQSMRGCKPGSPEAARLKEALIAEGLWSPYLEVAIGPDAEIFTKAPPLASVGWGADIGIRADSHWNNPEPEIVLVVNSKGEAVGATLGNDVNLRDIEGRSALLLGKAKDNNASTALGPFIRLFDDRFTLDDMRQAVVSLTVEGPDNFRLEGENRMAEISRDPLAIAAQVMSNHHYPDGFVIFLGTLFAPTQDRDAPGQGFTHKHGDVVHIASPRLGTLTNRVADCAATPPWEMGIAALMRNLAARGLLEP